jgi:large subunit ribosomal protein L29
MKANQLREMSVDELRKDHKELLDALYKLRFQRAAGQMDNPAKMGTLRRDIARILTVLQEKSHVA